MMDKLKVLMQGFLGRWNALSFNQKIIVGTMIIALMLSTAFLFQRAQDDYDVLYSNLSVADAAAIVAQLKEEKRAFRLADGGTTIMVPRDQKNGLILDTAGQLSGEGNINLTSIPPVVSGDVQKEWIKKLNTQEIVAALQSIRGIKKAQVIVSQPERNLFIEQSDPPTASVMLTVEPGFRLREEQVKTIKNLVGHSVPGLKPENVAISDNAGNSLEGPGSVGSLISNADIRRTTFEETTAKKVMRVLAPVVGKENVVVSVSAILNFDQSQTEINRVIPSGGTSDNPTGVAVSTQTQTEEYSGDRKKGPGGATGVEANAPTYGAEDAEQADSNYKMGKQTTNYEISKENKTVVYAPGAVERMTVAVVLNKVLTAQETEEIENLVANAAGVDLARGDSIDIKGFQFSEKLNSEGDALAEAARHAQEQAFWLQLATIITVGLMVIVASVIFYNLIRQPVEGELVEEEEGYEYFEEPDQLLEAESLPALEAKLDPEMEHMRESIHSAIEQDPSEAARLLVAYMKDI